MGMEENINGVEVPTTSCMLLYIVIVKYLFCISIVATGMLTLLYRSYGVLYRLGMLTLTVLLLLPDGGGG